MAASRSDKSAASSIFNPLQRHGKMESKGIDNPRSQRHCRELESAASSAQHAHYYFLARRSLMRWHAEQADLFNQRSRRLKMRLVLRMWKEKVAARKIIDDSLSSSVLEDSIRAHTAPITPRPTRRHLWRNINSNCSR
jgi:hypothetical protein